MVGPLQVLVYVSSFLYMSQAQKVGYRIWKMVHVLLKGSKAGMLVDVQVSWLDLTAHAQSFPGVI